MFGVAGDMRTMDRAYLCGKPVADGQSVGRPWESAGTVSQGKGQRADGCLVDTSGVRYTQRASWNKETGMWYRISAAVLGLGVIGGLAYLSVSGVKRHRKLTRWRH